MGGGEMAKPYNRALYVNINNKLVCLGDEPQVCNKCNVPFWEVLFCPQCEHNKKIRVCANALNHTQRPGFFFVQKSNQQFCSTRCELPLGQGETTPLPARSTGDRQIILDIATPLMLCVYLKMQISSFAAEKGGFTQCQG